MYQVVDVVPAYIRQKYPSFQMFNQALYTGEIVRDCYGNFHLREEFQPYSGYAPIYTATPLVPASQSLDEFEFFNIKGIRGFYKEEADGFLIELVSAEDIARGAGLVKKSTGRYSDEVLSHFCDNGFEAYEVIQWSRFNDYAKENLPFITPYLDPRVLQYIPDTIDRDSFIPIELAVRVLNNCRSEKAKQFQAVVEIEISNRLRMINREKHNKQMIEMQDRINVQTQQIEDQTQVTNHITDYYTKYNNTSHCFTSTELAKLYGLSAQIFNKLLHRLGVIYPVNGTWQIYQRYADLGCITSKNDNGTVIQYWTEKGKLVVSVILMNYGIEEGKPNQEIVERLLDEY